MFSVIGAIALSADGAQHKVVLDMADNDGQGSGLSDTIPYAPRLDDVSPEGLGDLVLEGIRGHVERLCMDIGLATYGTGIPSVRYWVADLVIYARRGQSMGAPVDQYMRNLLPLVWLRAADPGTFAAPEFEQACLDDVPCNWVGELVLVMHSAIAREFIEQGQDVDIPYTAALASVHSSVVQALVDKGEIKAEFRENEWRICATEAQRWLKLRGVQGF